MRKELTLKTQILYGVGVSYAIVDQIFAQWILYFYIPTEASGLKSFMAPAMVSLALSISRLVDMISDPLVGYLSDKIDTKYGRRIPFIAAGAIPLGLTTVAFFYPNMANEKMSFLYLATVGALFFIFYTIVGAPYNALIPEIGATPKEKVNLSTWQSVFRLIYTAIAMIIPGVLIAKIGKGNTLTGIRGMVIFLSIIAVVGIFVTVFSVKEKEYSKPVEKIEDIKTVMKKIAKEKNFYFYLLGLLFFFVGFNNLRAIMNYYVEGVMGYGKGMITVAAGILFGTAALFFYPTNLATRKYGYKKLMLLSLVALTILSWLLTKINVFLPVNAGFVIFALLGIPISGSAFIFPPAMMSEISEKISMKMGNRIEGVCFGIQGFFLKMAFLISAAVLPSLLVIGNGKVATRYGIEMAALFSAVSFIISFIFYYFYEE